MSQLAAGDSARNAPPIVHDALRSPGVPLDSRTRSFFEPRFGRDLSRVRVHTGPQAAGSAKAVNAAAYSVGQDLVFDEGEYAPDTTHGQRLLAHELAHVMQPDAGLILRRQPKNQQPAGQIRPLVQKLIDGKATDAERKAVANLLIAKQLNQAEVQAVEKFVKEQIVSQLAQQGLLGGVRIKIPGESGDVHTFFKARLQLKLSGATKALVGGFEGTVETTAEAWGTQQEKALHVMIAPPEGDTALAAYIRTNVFHNKALEFRLGETALKALNSVSIFGVVPITLTGGKKAGGRGLVVTLPEIPSDVTMEVALSQSPVRPQVAPPTGAPAVPPPRVFATGGIGSAAKDPKAAQGTQTIGAATVGADLPLFTDTSNSLIYGGVGVRGHADTRGGISGTGALFAGYNFNPITLQAGFEAGVGRDPGTGTGPDAGPKTGAVFGFEASASYKLKHVEIMALASVLGGKDIPASESIQLGAAYRF
jgi:hypothetical protein